MEIGSPMSGGAGGSMGKGRGAVASVEVVEAGVNMAK